MASAHDQRLMRSKLEASVVTLVADCRRSLNSSVVCSNLFLSNYDGYQFHEVDLFNAGKIGRRWFGEKFDLDEDKVEKFFQH